MSNVLGDLVARVDNVVSPQETSATAKDNEYLNNITKQIFNLDNIEVKTELNSHQINVFTKALTFAKLYNLPIIEDFIDTFNKLSLSKDRKSRKEFTEISKSLLASTQQNEETGLLGHLMGK